jgi:hypothetical protein
MSDYGDFTPIKVGCSTMRSPEDFPADIREKAWRLVNDQMCSDGGVCTFQNGCGCFEAVARALMERDRAATERAAKIADTIEQPGVPGTGEWLALGNFAGQIAAAIRSQP